MAKMTKTQRNAILSYNDGPQNRGILLAWLQSTADVLVRNGWAFYRDPTTPTRTVYVTAAGLIAAGFDMDAIHAEAIKANEAFDRIAAKCAAAMVAIGEAQREQDSPRGRRFNAAVIEGKSYRAALDILHTEAIAEDEAWEARQSDEQEADLNEQAEALNPTVPVLNETITHITDQVTPWPGEAWVTHHVYGEQLHRSPDEAEHWNARQAWLAATHPRSGDALADLRRAIHDVPDRSQRQTLRAHLDRAEAALRTEPGSQSQVTFIGYTDQAGNWIDTRSGAEIGDTP